MFRPAEDRLDYASILVPPAGYKCEFAIGTTYSLDLEALIGVPLALFLGEEMDGTLLENPVYVLEALRKAQTEFVLFCEVARSKCRIKQTRCLPYWKTVFLRWFEKRSFHPKVWLVKYIDSNEALYRLIVLSRNLTFGHAGM